MSFPLQDARLCLDCDTVFNEPRCPRCSSESYFPLSRWVRPALASDTSPSVIGKRARNTSLVLVGSGVAYALWKLLGNSATNQKPEDKSQKTEARPALSTAAGSRKEKPAPKRPG